MLYAFYLIMITTSVQINNIQNYLLTVSVVVEHTKLSLLSVVVGIKTV